MKNFTKLFIASLLFIFSASKGQSQINYSWNQVKIGGSGAVPGFIVHPKVPDLYFVTTDVGTPYRWNSASGRWESMMLFNKIPTTYWHWEFNQRCGDLAVDPNDATGNILYATVQNSEGTAPGYGIGSGDSQRGTVLKSTDRGETWVDLQLSINVKPNYRQRFSANRITVDPKNSNVVWVVTDFNGAYKSNTAGGNWKKITGTTIADSTPNIIGIRFVQFDESGGTTVNEDGQTVSKRIYIGGEAGIYKSEDGGASFAIMPGSPAACIRATLHKDGTMYVNAAKSVYKFKNGAWQDITPLPLASTDPRYYCQVAVNPLNSNEIVVGTRYAWQKDPVFRSNQGGAPGSYTQLTITRDNSQAPHSANDGIPFGSPAHNNHSYVWDPFHPNRIWANDMSDVLVTNNIWDPVVNWKIEVEGIEEVMVTGPMVAPPSGKNELISVTADIGGADHRSLTSPLVTGAMSYGALGTNIRFGLNSQSAAFQYNDPNFIVRVGSDSWDQDALTNSRAGYSTDGGDTYTKFPVSPGIRGRVAVSANSRNIVWVTQKDANGAQVGHVYWSSNLGSTWTRSTGAPEGILPAGGQWYMAPGQNHLVADKVNGNYFYIWDRGNFYVSSDAGKTFVQKSATGLYANNGSNPSLSNSGYATTSNVEVTPGKTGDVWIAFFNPSYPSACALYRTQDTGRTFQKVGDANFKPKWIAAAMSDTTPNAHLVLYCTSANFPINGVYFGAFRSDDTARTWQTICDRVPGVVMNMTADNKGRMFMGISGNGLWYGTPILGPLQSISIQNLGSDSVVTTYSTQLKALLTPSYPSNPQVTWSSSNTSIAIVDGNGKVTGVSPGLVTITCKSATDSTITSSKILTIINPIISTSVLLDSVVYAGYTSPTQIMAVVLPANTTNQALIWTVTDPTYATVDNNGTVTGKKLGSTFLIARTVDGGAADTAILVINTIVAAINAGTEGTIYQSKKIGQYIPEGTPANIVNSPNNWNAGYTGSKMINSQPINLTKAKRPAPKQVYECARWTKYTASNRLRYSLKGLIPNSTYEISVHFVDTAKQLNKNLTNVMVGADTVIKKLDVYKRVGAYTAFDSSFIAKSDASGWVNVIIWPDSVQYTPWIDMVAAVDARIIPLQSISIQSLSGKDSIAVNNRDSIILNTVPLTASNKKLTYISSDNAIATVDLNGVVKGISPGTAVITAISIEGGLVATFTYTVYYLPVSSITVSPNTTNVFVGDNLQLTSTVTPANASTNGVTWSSSDTTIAKVNANGKVVGVKEGDVLITVSSNDTSVAQSATANIHVANVLATSLSINTWTPIFGERDTMMVKPTFAPANTTIRKLNWSVSDATVASIDSNGIVKAIDTGTVTVSATTTDGTAITATKTLTVVPYTTCGFIENNSFESDLIKWIPKGMGNAVDRNAVVSATGKGRTGDKALAFITGESSASPDTSIQVIEGGLYRLSAWYKIEATGGQLPWWAGSSLDVLDASGTKLIKAEGVISSLSNITTQWVQVVKEVTVPTGGVTLGIWTAKAGPGILYMDDVCLELIKNDAALNLTGAGTYTYDAQPHAIAGTAYINGDTAQTVLPAVTFNYMGINGTSYGPSTNAPVNAGQYSVSATYAGSAIYNPATSTVSIIINKAQPTATVSSGGTHTYDAQPHGITATVTGVNGEDLTAVSTIQYNGVNGTTYSSAYAPQDAGEYNGTVSFAGNENYLSTSAASSVIINKATAQVTITATNAVYDGQPHGATVNATGVNNQQLNADVTYTGINGTVYNSSAAPVNAGEYSVTATYAGNQNYAPATATANFTIAKATSTITLTGGTFAYDGQPHSATASTTGVNGETLLPAATVLYEGANGTTYASTSTAPSNAGTYHISAQFAGNENYQPATATATLVISQQQITVTVANAQVQYSDPLPQLKGYATGLSTGVTVTYATTATQYSAPGTYPITATINGVNANYNVVVTNGTLTILQEDARLSYTGNTYVKSSGNGSATVVLKSTVKDITAVTGDAAYDANGGDIRNAKVYFKVVETGQVFGPITPTLLSSADTKTGTVTYNWAMNLGSAQAKTYTVQTYVDGYYTRNIGADAAVVTVARPSANLVSGGGTLLLISSAGIKAGDNGSITNFGFWATSGIGSVDGMFNVIIRKTANGTLRTYQVTGNVQPVFYAYPSMLITPGSTGFDGNAAITDITNPTAPVVVESNAFVTIDGLDYGSSGTYDKLAITVQNSSGNLWYASNFSSGATQQQTIASGNVSVAYLLPTIIYGNAFAKGEASQAEQAIAATSDAVEELTVKAFPNPATAYFTLDIKTKDADKVVVRVVDVNGKLVFTETGAAKTYRFGDRLQPGIYFLQVLQGKNVRQLKLIKQ